MRYYIQAYRQDGTQVLGNLDGQRALGELKKPLWSHKWRRVVKGPIPAMGYVTNWALVDENDRVIDRAYRSHWNL